MVDLGVDFFLDVLCSVVVGVTLRQSKKCDRLFYTGLDIMSHERLKHLIFLLFCVSRRSPFGFRCNGLSSLPKEALGLFVSTLTRTTTTTLEVTTVCREYHEAESKVDETQEASRKSHDRFARFE